MKYIRCEVKDNIARIVLNRPEVLNALCPELYDELSTALTDVESDRAIRAVIITGAGKKAFAAGADIAAMQPYTANQARIFATKAQRPLNLISQLPQPVIAAVNGLALGGGCELALACDLRIASTAAKFGQPEINLAIIPGGGGTQRLARVIGIACARELIFTGRLIGAQEALTMGLVSRVVPDQELMPCAEELALAIARKAPIAMRLAKAAINKSADLPTLAGLDYEIECFAECFATQDQKEAMDAFLAKRPPRIEGR